MGFSNLNSLQIERPTNKNYANEMLLKFLQCRVEFPLLYPFPPSTPLPLFHFPLSLFPLFCFPLSLFPHFPSSIILFIRGFQFPSPAGEHSSIHWRHWFVTKDNQNYNLLPLKCHHGHFFSARPKIEHFSTLCHEALIM